MSTDKNIQSTNWMNSWWFKGIVVLAFILVGILDIVFWNSALILAIWGAVEVFLEKIKWEFIALLGILIFRDSIHTLLSGLGDSVGRIRKISIGDKFSLSSDELTSVLVDREVLKMSIKVAMAYDGIDRNEQIYLLNRASPMKNHVQNLADVEKWQVIEEAINIALMDNEIQNPEYFVIQDVAVKLYRLEPSQVDELIMKECFARKNAKPPKLLEKEYNKKYGKLK